VVPNPKAAVRHTFSILEEVSKRKFSRRSPFSMMSRKAIIPLIGLWIFRGGMGSIVKGYVRTLRPKFNRFRDRRKKKRAVSENEKRRRRVSTISLRDVRDKMSNASNDEFTATRIIMGFLKKTCQKR